MEKKTTIKVPEAYVSLLEDIRLLTADQNNPNRPPLSSKSKFGGACKSTVGPTQY